MTDSGSRSLGVPDLEQGLREAPDCREQRRIPAIGVNVVRIQLERLPVPPFRGEPVAVIHFQDVGEGGVRFGEIAVDLEGPRGRLFGLRHRFGGRQADRRSPGRQ